jgi:hypothetical protein
MKCQIYIRKDYICNTQAVERRRISSKSRITETRTGKEQKAEKLNQSYPP